MLRNPVRYSPSTRSWRLTRCLLMVGLVMLPWSDAFAAAPGGHGGELVSVLLGLVVVLAAAQLGGTLAARFGQPAVLGELLAGILVGSFDLMGLNWFVAIEQSVGLDLLAQLGVLILLFEVGLESTVSEMAAVGKPSLAAAVLGVVAPFGLGWAVSAALMPEQPGYVHAFVGATLTATSIGVTARTLKDLGQSKSAEARIILGAAVIDDILGLITLAVVAGVIGAIDLGQSFSIGAMAMIALKAIGFLVGAIVVGTAVAPRWFSVASRLQGRGVLLITALIVCFGLAYLANLFGLAPIVGGFAAGLILERAHFAEFINRGEPNLEHSVHPLSAFLVPIFFVMMGAKVDVRTFAAEGTLVLATLLTAAAVIGKQACGLGVWRAGINRVAVGIGMIPRGEVGLIFANVGLGLTVGGVAVVDQRTFSAIVIMVILTTMVAPPLLGWAFARSRHPGGTVG